MIDNLPCDLSASCAVAGYNADKTANVEACREGRSLRLILPSSPRNDAVMGFAGDPHTGTRFNEVLHRAVLSTEGSALLSGTIRLLGCSEEGYSVELRDGGAQWAANAALRMFNTLGVEYDTFLTAQTVAESWTNDSPVKFFPIHRDEYPQGNSSTDLLSPDRLLTVDDYYPFLHIATLVKRIFAEAGYTIESRFLESPLCQSLYMSGAYSSHDTTAAAARMGFFARRLAPSTTTADYLGCAYANPLLTFSSLGNLVDTATPQSLDVDGEPIPELMNNGNCFSVENRRIVFTPPAAVSVGFEYYLKYTTAHRILSRTRLTGFDSVYLGVDTTLNFNLANRYKDRRGEIVANFSYLAIVFDHPAGAQYRLTFTRNGVQGTLWTEFSGRSVRIDTPTGTLSTPVLHIRIGSAWVPYTGDWALYDGYITEEGQTTVELRVHTAAEQLAAATPRRFDGIFFFGAEQGMSITLHKECSLRPRFRSSPGFGSRIHFADVAQHRIRQIELLEAVAHLFNLRFYTEEQAHRVWIEPADMFYGSGAEADWRSKSDFSQPVLREELAAAVHERRTWSYPEGDGAVKRLEAEDGTPFGAWSVTTPGYASLQGEEERRNPLFCPTVNSRGHYTNAPSALLMQIGDRDSIQEQGEAFTPRIVCYAGMQSLPATERWGYPSNEAAYPLAAFHCAEVGVSLCFGDRSGIGGLHRYYDRQVTQEATRERITLSLRIAPHEFEALLTPGTGVPDIRSRFHLDTGAGEVFATLHSIDAYDPEAGSARCTFIRTPED